MNNLWNCAIRLSWHRQPCELRLRRACPGGTATISPEKIRFPDPSPSGSSRRDDDYLAKCGRWLPDAFEPDSHRSAGTSPTGAEKRNGRI